MSEPPMRKKWSDLPLAVRRLAWWWLLPLVAIIAGAAWFWFAGGLSLFAALGVGGGGGRRPWMGVLIPLAVNAPLFVTMGVVFRAIRRMRRAYAASDGRLCTNCEHDLRGLGESGACPECGRLFEIERDQRAWHQAGIRKIERDRR